MKMNLCMLGIILVISLSGQSYANEVKKGTELTEVQAIMYLQRQISGLEKRIEILELELQLVRSQKSDSICLPRDEFNRIKVEIRDSMQVEFTKESKVAMESQLDMYKEVVNICEED